MLKGYGDSTVELVPNRALIEYSETLHKGATKTNVVTKVPEKPGGPTTKPGDATVKPDTPEIKPVDIKPADTKPADTQKPPDKPKDDCPEDEQPCLKTNIPGMGSGTGSGN